MMKKILELRSVSKTFQSGTSTIQVLNDVNFSLEEGESVAIIGPSGAGKSTFLQIAALLEKPTSGEILINEISTANLNDDEKTKLRGENIGFVYQFHNLLPEFSALENVVIPQLILGKIRRNEAFAKAEDLLISVGLEGKFHQSPKTMSGGEQQRVAIARALANDPKIVIADEPTGNLDPNTASMIFEMFLNVIAKNKTAIIMATHNLELAKRFSKTVAIENGTLLKKDF